MQFVHKVQKNTVLQKIQFSSVIFRVAKVSQITSRTTMVPDVQSDNKIRIQWLTVVTRCPDEGDDSYLVHSPFKFATGDGQPSFTAYRWTSGDHPEVLCHIIIWKLYCSENSQLL